jgi:hypothetical protein
MLMFSWISRRATYANIVATLALVFAMSGGALAASRYLITSTKQIKPSVLASLKGAKGAAGAQGSAGAAGPQGPGGAAGAKGETGAAGKEGAQGVQGPAGPTGAKGAAGAEGSPWTAGGTLPSGKTETGSWSAYSYAPAGNLVAVPISFPIPLAAPSAHVVHLNRAETEASVGKGGCELDIEDPSFKAVAPPDTLCIFTREEEREIGGRFVFVGAGEYEGDYPSGALLRIEAVETEAGLGAVAMFGTWAVTAK